MRSSPVLAMKPSMRPGRPRASRLVRAKGYGDPRDPRSAAFRRRAGHATDGLPEGARWSTWDQSILTQRCPESQPDWLVTDRAAVDTELGILKIGKEADVFLLRRGQPAGRSCLLAAKQYRTVEHRMFHRDSGCLEGRRRVGRAVDQLVSALVALAGRASRTATCSRTTCWCATAGL